MISLSFHFGIILGAFAFLVALYATIFLFRNKTPEGYITPTLLGQLQMVLLATTAIMFVDLITRTVSSLQMMDVNLYWLEGLLAFVYLFGIFMNAFAITRDEKRRSLALSLWGIVALVSIAFWLKTNVGFGFNPLISNPNLVLGLHFFWVLTGTIWIIGEWRHREQRNEIKCALDNAVVRLWGFFLVGQILSLFGGRFELSPLYSLGCLIALPNIFLLYLVVDTDFVSIDYYKRPFLYLKERIIMRMILTLSILIVIALELINFATLYIVKTDLAEGKTKVFHQKIAEAENIIHKSYDTDRNLLETALQSTGTNTSEYVLGITLFNKMTSLPGINKIVILSGNQKPLMTVTHSGIQEPEGSDLESTPYNDLLVRSREKGYSYSFHNYSKSMVIAKRLIQASEVGSFYVVAYFDADPVFEKLRILSFEKNGDVQVLGNDYSPLYAARASESLREESKHEHILEVSEIDPVTGLVILIRQPEVDAFSGLQKAQYISFFFTTFSIMAFLGIAFLFLRMIEGPLRKLQMGARSVGMGDLDHLIDIQEKNEFYYLARAFNHMVQDLKKLQQKQMKNEQLLSITSMSVGLNHEINNPLAAILMSNQMVQKMIQSFEPDVSEDGQKKLALIDATCLRIDEEGKRIKNVLEYIQHVNEPIMEDYVDGTKMMKVKFD